MEKREVTFITYNEVNTLIKETFEFSDYNCVEYEEWNNDSCYSFDLDGELDDWGNKKVNTALSTKKPDMYGLRNYLNYLVKINKLPKGEYIVEVNW